MGLTFDLHCKAIAALSFRKQEDSRMNNVVPI